MKEFIGIYPVNIDYAELNPELDECVAGLIHEYQLLYKK
jgi:hypothetical protein